MKWQAVPGPGSQRAIHKHRSHEVVKKWQLPAIKWCLKHHGQLCVVRGGRNRTIPNTGEVTSVSNGPARPVVQRDSQELPVCQAQGILRSLQPRPRAPAGGSASAAAAPRPVCPGEGLSSHCLDRQHRKCKAVKHTGF